MHRPTPRSDIGIVAITTDGAVTPERVHVVRAWVVLTGRGVHIGTTPRITWNRLAEVGTSPVTRSFANDRYGAKCVEPLRRGRKNVVVQAIGIEREREDIQLTLCCTHFCITHVAKHRWRHYRGERRDDS